MCSQGRGDEASNVSWRLWHRAVLAAEWLPAADAATGDFGEIAGPQAVGTEGVCVEPGRGDAAFQDQIDRL